MFRQGFFLSFAVMNGREDTMRSDDKRVLVVFCYCLIVAALLAAAPWLDWAKYGDMWVANLAALPALPGLFMVYRRSRPV